MDAILGHRPSTRPLIAIDSLDTDTVLSTQSSTQDKEEAEAVEEKNEFGSPSSLNSSTTSLPQAGGSGNQGRKRKRPSTMADSAVIDLLEQVITVQSKSDERMAEVEEKRLRMEERQMEREALQRRKERAFQMKMMMMMMMGPGMHPLPPPPPPPPPPSTRECIMIRHIQDHFLLTLKLKTTLLLQGHLKMISKLHEHQNPDYFRCSECLQTCYFTHDIE